MKLNNMTKNRNGVDLCKITFCPSCNSDLIYENNKIICNKCNETYHFKEGVPVLMDKSFSIDLFANLNTESAWENYDTENINPKIAKFSSKAKSIFQKITPHYRVQTGPNYIDFIKKYVDKGNILDLAGGPCSIEYPGVVNCDINNYKTVDVIADARRMPFKDNCFKAIICNSVLEHIFETDMVVDECHRILENNGYVFMCVPQVCSQHHTIDYFRWTIPGLKKQFDKFNIVDEGVILGPSTFINQIFVGVFKSFTRFSFLNNLICFILEIILFPLRFLDLLIKNNKDYQNYAHTIYIIGKKEI